MSGSDDQNDLEPIDPMGMLFDLIRDAVPEGADVMAFEGGGLAPEGTQIQTAEDMTAGMYALAEAIGEDFKTEDDDWPSCLIVMQAGSGEVVSINLSPAMNHPYSKELITQILPRVLDETKTERMVVLFNVRTQVSNMRMLIPGMHPNLRELAGEEPEHEALIVAYLDTLLATKVSGCMIERDPDDLRVMGERVEVLEAKNLLKYVNAPLIGPFAHAMIGRKAENQASVN